MLIPLNHNWCTWITPGRLDEYLYRICVTRGWCKRDEASSWIWFSFMSALLPLQLSLNLTLTLTATCSIRLVYNKCHTTRDRCDFSITIPSEQIKKQVHVFVLKFLEELFDDGDNPVPRSVCAHMILQHIDDSDCATTTTWFDLVIRQYTRHYPERTRLQEILSYDSKVNDGWIHLVVKVTDWQCGSIIETIRRNVQLGWCHIDQHILISPSTMIQYKQSLLWMDHVISLSSCFKRGPSKKYGTGHTSARFTCLFQSTFIGPGMTMMDGWIQIKCNDAGILEYSSTCISLVSTKDVSCHVDKMEDWWRGDCVFHYTTAYSTCFEWLQYCQTCMPKAQSLDAILGDVWYNGIASIQWWWVIVHTRTEKTLYSMLLFQSIIPMDPQWHCLHDQLQRWWMYNSLETNSTTCNTLVISWW